jgi:hypothetical protein
MCSGLVSCAAERADTLLPALLLLLPCSLHNPLQRQERLSTGWFGVICSFDGVLVEDTHPEHARAWLQVAEEMNLPRPLGQTLNRIKGARDEVVGVVQAAVKVSLMGPRELVV